MEVIDYAGFLTTKGSCKQGTLKNLFDRKIIDYRIISSKAQLTIAGYYCDKSKYFLEEKMTTERCKDIVLEKQKEGVCDSDYFYWDANERNQDDCFCCLGKEIDYKRSRSYSTY